MNDMADKYTDELKSTKTAAVTMQTNIDVAQMSIIYNRYNLAFMPIMQPI